MSRRLIKALVRSKKWMPIEYNRYIILYVLQCLYLPRSCVSPEIGKLSRKPVVDFIESQLSIWGLQNSLRIRKTGQKLKENQTEKRDGEIL